MFHPQSHPVAFDDGIVPTPQCLTIPQGAYGHGHSSSKLPPQGFGCLAKRALHQLQTFLAAALPQLALPATIVWPCSAWISPYLRKFPESSLSQHKTTAQPLSKQKPTYRLSAVQHGKADLVDHFHTSNNLLRIEAIVSDFQLNLEAFELCRFIQRYHLNATATSGLAKNHVHEYLA